jgi:hypothetical protein
MKEIKMNTLIDPQLRQPITISICRQAVSKVASCELRDGRRGGLRSTSQAIKMPWYVPGRVIRINYLGASLASMAASSPIAVRITMSIKKYVSIEHIRKCIDKENESNHGNGMHLIGRSFSKAKLDKLTYWYPSPRP